MDDNGYGFYCELEVPTHHIIVIERKYETNHIEDCIMRPRYKYFTNADMYHLYVTYVVCILIVYIYVVFIV